MFSPRTARLSQGISEKTTIASLERNNNQEQNIFSQDLVIKNHIIAPDLKMNKEHVPFFLRNCAVGANPVYLREKSVAKYFQNAPGKIENVNYVNNNNFNNAENMDVVCFNKPIQVNSVHKQISGNNINNKNNVSEIARILQTNAANLFASNKATYSNLNSLNKVYSNQKRKSNGRTSIMRKNNFTAAEAAEILENEEIHKFNSWNDNSRKPKENKNNFQETPLEKKIVAFNSLNSSLISRDKSVFLEPHKSNKELLKVQTQANSQKLEKTNQLNSQKEFNFILNKIEESKKNFVNKDFYNENEIENRKLNDLNNTFYLSSNVNFNNENSLVEKLNAKKISDDFYSMPKMREFSNCNTPSIFDRDGNFKLNNQFINEEENSDAESIFSVESQFVTNNRKKFMRKESKNQKENENQTLQLKNFPKISYISNDGNHGNNNNNNHILKDYGFAFFQKEKNYFSNINNSIKNNKINSCNNNINNNRNNFNNDNNNKNENSFNSAVSCEFADQTDKNNPHKTNAVNTPIPYSNAENQLINKNKDELESERNNDFIRKFNTSDAVKPQKVFLELNKANNLTTNDPMLIVTAEIDVKKNLLGNIFSSYNGSNYKSNRSTSNESKDNNNNNNIFNSKSSNSNMNNYYPKESNSFNNNAYKNNNQQQTNKTYEEKELMNNIMKVNTGCRSDSGHSATNTNIVLNSNNNTNITSKKKPLQKNQIFFPTEINIRNLNPNQK